MTAAVQKIVEEVKSLGEEERRELIALLETLDDEQSGAATEEEFARNLANKGMVSLANGTLSSAKPVPITGKPVSEIIVEERR